MVALWSGRLVVRGWLSDGADDFGFGALFGAWKGREVGAYSGETVHGQLDGWGVISWFGSETEPISWGLALVPQKRACLSKLYPPNLVVSDQN